MVFDSDAQAGGMMRTQIPKFRLPDESDRRRGRLRALARRRPSSPASASRASRGSSPKVGTRCSSAAARRAAATSSFPAGAKRRRNIHIGIDWLASVSFGHTSKIGRRVIVLGGGNTAMDCCRTARRLGGEEVKVVVRSGFAEMKASPWEKEDALHEGVEILNLLVPKAFLHEGGG